MSKYYYESIFRLVVLSAPSQSVDHTFRGILRSYASHVEAWVTRLLRVRSGPEEALYIFNVDFHLISQWLLLLNSAQCLLSCILSS